MSNAHPFPADPLRVVHLKGTDREIGRQHAEALADVCHKGMPKFYHEFWQRIADQKGSLPRRLGFAAVRKVLDPFVVNRMLKEVPVEALDRLDGLAEVAGLNRRELKLAMVLPDLLPVAQALFCRLFPSRFLSPVPEFGFGCSSFVSKGERFLVGRNLDFPGVCFWDRYPVVQCTSPNNTLRYISFTTAGVPIGGITGINEAQIYLAVHQHYCRAFSLGGTLPFFIGEKVLQNARTLQEAETILSASRFANAWAFIVADGKTKDAFIFEGSPAGNGIRRLNSEDPTMAHSNYFQTATCKPAEYSTSARMGWDNYWRKTRLEQLAKAAWPKLDPAGAVKAISDQFDPFWGEEKIVNRIVSQSLNIQSVVLDVASMEGWMAVGDAPVHIRDYVKLDIGKILSGAGADLEDKLPGFRFRDPAMGRAKENLVLASVYGINGEEEEALRRVEASLGDFFTPEVAQVAGILSMKEGLLEKAGDWFQKGIEKIESKVAERALQRMPPEYYELLLFAARLADLKGKREESLGLYRKVAGAADFEDPHIRQIAKRARPFRAKDLDRLIMPFSAYVPFA